MTEQSTAEPADEQVVTTETRWAVRWTPQAALTETGTTPPWSADYQRWLRSPDARVYRQVITTTVAVSASDWAESELSTRPAGGDDRG